MKNCFIEMFHKGDFYCREGWPFLKTILSVTAIFIVLLGLISLLSFYISAAFQPFRGPTKIYFFGFLFCAFISLRVAIFVFVMMISWLPNLHTQLELVVHPAVKYFVEYPAVDATAGLFLGIWLKKCFARKKFVTPIKSIDWPIALLFVLIMASCGLAISRNLWQSASSFLFSDLINSILNFKFLQRSSDYFPITEFITFASLGLIITVLSEIISNTKDKLGVIFKPTIVGLGMAAVWGIVQATTGFGLKEDIINIRGDFIGYGAIGFQPDIHAYAGLMALGAVGLFCYLYQLRSRVWRYCAMATIGLCWAALFLSKSRATFALALGLSLAFIIIRSYHFNKARTVQAVLLGLVCCVVLTVYFFSRSALVFFDSSSNSLSDTYDIINLMSSWRLDLFLGALRMWSQLPLMGVGQGNFLRVSTNYEFSGSALMAMAGGQNAHNYFLQTLTELGAVGFFCIVCVFVWPVLQRRSHDFQWPTFAAIAALFLGNIYSHSFVIRENLFLLALFVALLYGTVGVSTSNASIIRTASETLATWLRMYGLLGVCLVSFFAWREMVSAYGKTPFQKASQCYWGAASEQWTRGQLIREVTPETVAVTLFIASEYFVDGYLADSVEFKLFDRLRTRPYTGMFVERSREGAVYAVTLPSGEKIGNEGGVLVVKVKHCFTSQDLSDQSTGRSLNLPVAIFESFIGRE